MRKSFGRKMTLSSLLVFVLISTSQAVQFPSSSSSQKLPFQHSRNRSKRITKKRYQYTSLQNNDLNTSVRGGSGEETSSSGSSMTASVFNLVNNVAGAGILTLAAGKAKGSGWIPSILLCTALGLISSHTFTMIGQDCELTGEADFKVCVDHIQEILGSFVFTLEIFVSGLYCKRVFGDDLLEKRQHIL